MLFLFEQSFALAFGAASVRNIQTNKKICYFFYFCLFFSSVMFFGNRSEQIVRSHFDFASAVAVVRVQQVATFARLTVQIVVVKFLNGLISMRLSHVSRLVEIVNGRHAFFQHVFVERILGLAASADATSRTRHDF